MRSTVDIRGFINSIGDDLFEVLVPSRFYGSISVAVGSSNSDATIVHAMNIVDASTGNIVLTLPDATTNEGNTFTIKKVDNTGYTVSVRTTSDQTIDGESEQTITGQWVSMSAIAFGGNWYLV